MTRLAISPPATELEALTFPSYVLRTDTFLPGIFCLFPFSAISSLRFRHYSFFSTCLLHVLMMTTGAGGLVRDIARVLFRSPPLGLAPDLVPGPKWSVVFSASVGGFLLALRLRPRRLRSGLPRLRLRLLPLVIGEMRPSLRVAGIPVIGVLLRLRLGIVALAHARVDASLLIVLLRRRSVMLRRRSFLLLRESILPRRSSLDRRWLMRMIPAIASLYIFIRCGVLCAGEFMRDVFSVFSWSALSLWPYSTLISWNFSTPVNGEKQKSQKY